MRIKKYTAPTMRHALSLIRQELGEEAVILKSRKLPRKLFALGSSDEIEVTAAVDDEGRKADEIFSPLHMKETGVYSRTAKPASAFPQPPARKTPESGSSPAPAPATGPFPMAEIRDDIRELKDLLRKAMKNGDQAPAGEFSAGWGGLYGRLLDAEVKPELAARLIRAIQEQSPGDGAPEEKKLADILACQFPVSGPILLHPDKTATIAFVGPTGSGKTTTLAKLAAHLVVNKGKRVSIITADTYRIAAIEQVRTFADIVGIGLQVVFAPDEVAPAMAACENDDVVLIDTAGRSQRNTEHMTHLANLLAALKPDETHLVLSAGTKDSDLVDAIERYRAVGADRLAFTKLDETVRLGNVFNAVNKCNLPVSYFTFGQSIPDDIELATAGRFVARLWEPAKAPVAMR
jgi:flagellar biosynthesis protein FlhF